MRRDGITKWGSGPGHKGSFPSCSTRTTTTTTTAPTDLRRICKAGVVRLEFLACAQNTVRKCIELGVKQRRTCGESVSHPPLQAQSYPVTPSFNGKRTHLADMTGKPHRVARFGIGVQGGQLGGDAGNLL